MGVTNLDKKVASIYVNLLVFQLGGNTYNYAAFNRDIVISATTFNALPVCAIDFNKQSGGAKDEPVNVVMSAVPPLIDILDANPNTPVTVGIFECALSNPSATLRQLHYGSISKVTENKDGRPGLVGIQIDGIRKKFEVPLGIPALNTCAWTFGDKNCGLNVPALSAAETGGGLFNVSAVDGREITVLFGADAGKYRRGYMIFGTAKLFVRDHPTNTKIILAELPPSSLIVGSEVTMILGCLKTIQDCRDLWDNESRFGGFGLAIPSFHPTFETQ